MQRNSTTGKTGFTRPSSLHSIFSMPSIANPIAGRRNACPTRWARWPAASISSPRSSSRPSRARCRTLAGSRRCPGGKARALHQGDAAPWPGLCAAALWTAPDRRATCRRRSSPVSATSSPLAGRAKPSLPLRRRRTAGRRRTGLVLRSQPKVEVWPWPGTKLMSSPSGHSRLRIEFSSCSWLPRGKSVRPIEPRNSTSPTKATLRGLVHEHDMARRVAGAVHDVEGEVAEAHRLAVAQPAVGHERLVDREVVLGARVRQALDQEQVVLVRALDLDAVMLGHGAGGRGVVDMAVGQQHLGDLDALLVDRLPAACRSRRRDRRRCLPWSRRTRRWSSSAGTG